MKKKKVIIVGGGLAGLSAAYELSRRDDFEIHLIEQNSRLGGRVHTCSINGCEVDVGGFLVYPWYQRYHQLIRDLDFQEELVKVPEAKDYFVNDLHTQLAYNDEMALSFKEMLELFVKILPNALTDRNPTHPELHAYDDLTVQGYLKSLGLEPNRTDYLISVFDTYLQGYCYGSVAEHKMAFMASTLFQNMIHGDVHSASYLKCGSRRFINALAEELRGKGVEIRLNCKLTAIDGNRMTTDQGEMAADALLFCHPPASVPCTNFITATVRYKGVTQVEADADWGSCFYRENPKQPLPIVSIVNLEKLYGKAVAQHLNLNIKVNQQAASPIGSTELLEEISTQLTKRFKGITGAELVERADWKKAMPIAQESFVEAKRSEQGRYAHYFAGDFMGCPSMETALRTGQQAAAQLIGHAS